MKDLRDVRKDYQVAKLDLAAACKDPFQQFALWYEEIEKIPSAYEPNAMVLATVNEQAQPSARVVLLKGFNHEGFLFFTNYESQKGQELLTNNKAAVVFYWPDLERQVRLEGQVQRTDETTSDQYFEARPLGSQVSAIVSPQSQSVVREALEQQHQKLLHEFQNDSTKSKRPNYWGGYILKPHTFEFWQGRSDRLHDRIRYSKKIDTWEMQCLAP